jgi:hypothetical protein
VARRALANQLARAELEQKLIRYREESEALGRRFEAAQEAAKRL